ncbi:hypothetical protein ACIA5C_45045 [Actinoplanes sp. NPDC051343]|uniref:hypothetical protein n=1 Tax=Actinoplanes sp. NPDC051343 TaxID=3363906 RepID=UPI0037A6B815
MAGRLPDDLVSEARHWLAGGRVVDVAQAVAFAALAGHVAVRRADANLLRATLDEAGEDAEAITVLETAEAEPIPPFGLAPAGPEEIDEVPYSLDLTVAYDGPGKLDTVDEAARTAVEGIGTLGLWRSWRYPAVDTPWPPPRRVYLVQTNEEPWTAAAVVQTALDEAGEVHPQVEAFADPGSLPVFQRTALSFAALLWASTPAGPMPVTAAPTVFSADHSLLHDEEADRAMAYLEAGVPLLITPERGPDVAASGASATVPAGFRTDGNWIWSEAVAYYLGRYRFAPDSDLLDHLRRAGPTPPALDAVTLHRALSALYSGLAADSIGRS